MSHPQPVRGCRCADYTREA